MSFNFSVKESNPAVEFDFKDGAKVKLRTLSGEAYRDILKKSTSNKAIIEGGKVYQYPYKDDFLYSDLLLDYCIVSWTGFVDKGKDIPCTLENKSILYWNSDEFRVFIEKSLSELSKSEKEAEDEAIKN